MLSFVSCGHCLVILTPVSCRHGVPEAGARPLVGKAHRGEPPKLYFSTVPAASLRAHLPTARMSP